jgi:hypothetical protein
MKKMKYIANPVEVEALIIIKVGPVESDGSMLVHTEGGIPYRCTKGMIARYIPAEGDYLVRQSDDYIYLNPKDVFERKYRPA